ncbi:coiled-coil domain-containing protein 24 isoform X2 [Tachysurus fulvidraco]|uniref:coiled-coil domain-containing protein 24 isoform X2 n=1 Tax=Tachysurus fulvidraco TaxID=1234273 RepID=UPI000F5126C7|nr:coiled-coil domain-containing protein 24 isoform X2 [Tachysurus fulvidraco]
MEPFQRQQSVWSLIKECVPEPELPEIRAIIGDALIDMYKETYSEVQMWEQMWHEVHDGKSQMPHFSLADPPAIKELLRSELQLLLLTLRQGATTLGRDGAEVMSRYSPRVVNYALSTERQQSPDSIGCTTPTSRPESSRSSSRLSSHSSIEEEIQALWHKLNITHINEVVSHLRSVLTAECEVLKNDVQLLQESVELEYLKQSGFMEPSLTELKKERRLIQQDLEALNLMIESTSTDKLKSEVSQIASRDMKLTGLASDSEQKQSLVSPTTGVLQPKPPSTEAPSHDNRTRHRIPLKATQLSGSSSKSAQCQGLDLGNSHVHSVPQISSASSSGTAQSSPSESKTQSQKSVQSANCRLKNGTLAGHLGAAPISSVPAPPPAGQNGSSRGQRVGRRLSRLQTGNMLNAT